MSLPTLADLKTHLNITSTADDDELVGKLDAAVANVSKLIGPIEPGVVTEKHYGASGSSLLLRRMPVGAVTAVSVRSYGFAVDTSLTGADYEVDTSAGVLRMTRGGYFSGDYTVTYTTGMSQVPADVAEAVLIIAAHLWETQRGAAPVGPLAAADDTFATPGLGFAIPNRARELLAPYVRPAIA